MDLRCVLQEKTSEKTGKKYVCIYIPDIEKTVFLEPAEVKLLKLIYNKDENI